MEKVPQFSTFHAFHRRKSRRKLGLSVGQDVPRQIGSRPPPPPSFWNVSKYASGAHRHTLLVRHRVSRGGQAGEPPDGDKVSYALKIRLVLGRTFLFNGCSKFHVDSSYQKKKSLIGCHKNEGCVTQKPYLEAVLAAVLETVSASDFLEV